MYCYEAMDDAEMAAYEFWVSGVALFTVGVLGIVGNVLTLIALIQFETVTTFNRLLIHLTVVDLLLIVVCVHEFAVLNVFVGHQPFWYRLTFPYFIHPLKVSKRFPTSVRVSDPKIKRRESFNNLLEKRVRSNFGISLGEIHRLSAFDMTTFIIHAFYILSGN